MNILIIFTEFVNYLLFAFLVGYVALRFVKNDQKPKTEVPKKLLLYSVIGIVLFMFVPIMNVVYVFSGGENIKNLLYTTMTEFNIGKAWIFIFFVSILLLISFYKNSSKFIQAILLFLIIVAFSYSSHIGSLSIWKGTFSQMIHFISVTLWAGILMHVGWFSKNKENWSNFLKWFTPFAVGCIVLITISGLTLMTYVVEPKNYVKSWVLPYGQMLFLKHISVIPVLFFAIINAVLIKKTNESDSFNPLIWVKAESLTLLLVFFFTSILGTMSSAVHDLERLIKIKGASKSVEWLLNKNITTTENISFGLTIQSVLIISVSFMFLWTIYTSFKKTKPKKAVVSAFIFVVILYTGLMLGLTI